MQWIGISGSWRTTTMRLKRDVERAVTEILSKGNGIIVGGALGVDYIATNLAIDLNPSLERLRIYLPTSLSIFTAHYQKAAQRGVISVQQANELVKQLNLIKRTRQGSLIESQNVYQVNKSSYYARNRQIVSRSDYLLAFQVDRSPGTQHAIDYARKLGKRVSIYSYTTKE